ncbi:putative PDDEXK endonuclease [Thioalkalivibrio paradoxus]|nr:hypothetical protein [Thioalkalivibrio paradoxus]
MSRTKGAAGERELRRLLEAELGPGISRNLSQTRDGGHDLTGVGPFAIEVKRYKRATASMLAAWWTQAEAQAESAGLRPALAWREDRAPWRVLVRLADVRPGLGPWPGIEWTAAVTLPAFAALVRETGRAVR